MELGDQWLPASAPHGSLSTLSGGQMNQLFLSPFHTNTHSYARNNCLKGKREKTDHPILCPLTLPVMN